MRLLTVSVKRWRPSSLKRLMIFRGHRASCNALRTSCANHVLRNPCGYLDPAIDSKLIEKARHVPLYRPLRDEQPLSDCPVAKPLAHQTGHLDLAATESCSG